MVFYKWLFVMMIGISMPLLVQARDHSKKAHWIYEVKKKGGNEYDIIFHLKLNKGWSVWAPSVDGNGIPPSFTFNKNDKVEFKRGIKRKGAGKTEGTGDKFGKFAYYSGSVDFVQTIIVSGRTVLSGNLGYQVCRKMKSEEPSSKDFSFSIED